ncbi:MAG: hypothetical protein IKJ91_00885 [Clostridia bacterium]|nr:hypothetical protein [Clostridia bacterium]
MKKYLIIIILICLSIEMLSCDYSQNHNTTITNDNKAQHTFQISSTTEKNIDSTFFTETESYVMPETNTEVFTLQLDSLPLYNEANNKLAAAINAVFPRLRYSVNNYSLKDYSVYIDRNKKQYYDINNIGFDDYLVLANYGNELFDINAEVDDGVLYYLKVSSNTITGTLFVEPEKLEACAKMALAPALIFFKGINYNSLVNTLWNNMDRQDTKIIKETKYAKQTDTVYTYATKDFSVSLSLFQSFGQNGRENEYTYSQINVHVKINNNLLNKEKSSQKYINAKNKYEASLPKGTYDNWYFATDEERYYSAINLLESIFAKDNIFKKCIVANIGGIYSDHDISNSFIPINVQIYDLSLDTNKGNISFYVSGARDDLIYRIYSGNVNNNNYDWWRFDWDGNLIESTSNIAISNYIYELITGTSFSKENKQSNDTTDYLSNELEGIWVNIANSEKDYFEFLNFEKTTYRFGVYPGSYDRTAYLTNVIDKGNNTYSITFKYPSDEYFGDYYEEEIITANIKLENNVLVFIGENIEWVYMGKNLDEAITNVSNYHNGNISYEEPPLQSFDNDDSEIVKILKNEKNFIDFETKKSAAISTLPIINNNYMGTAGRYAIIDLDKDGKDELLVEYNANGDTAIIKYYKNNWTAFYISYREITLLKKDGTMFASSSAYESYVQRIFFSSNGIEFEKIIESNDNANTYIVNKKNVSKDECQKELNNFFEKELVNWIDF